MNTLVRHAILFAFASLVACQFQPMRPATPEPPAPSVAIHAPSSPATVVEPTPASAYFLLPEVAESEASGIDVLERLRGRFSEPACREHPRVDYWRQRYAASPKRFAAQIEDILPMMSLVLDELDRYQLPGEYALLPIAESWYRPATRGSGDHLGMWQIGRPTARTLGLRVDDRYDARLDPLASTDAALRYLAQMHNQFGDWRLATAAYNAGPYRVKKLLDGRDDTRFSLTRRVPAGLPDASFEHLARIEALACLLGQPERFGIVFSPEPAFDPLVSVALPDGQSSLRAIAEREEVPGDLLAALNPGFRNGFIASSAPRRLLVPRSLGANLKLDELPVVAAPAPVTASGAREHIVQRGDTLGAIARRHGVRLQTLFSLNGLGPRSILHLGQRIRLAD